MSDMMKERKEKKRMDKDLRTRLEVIAALATVAVLYLLNYLMGNLP